MKKLLLVLVILLVSTSLATAGISLRPNFGLGFGISKDSIALGDGQISLSTDKETSAAGVQTKNERIEYSGGAGINFGLGVLIGLTDNMAVEVAGSYVMGSETDVNIDNNLSTPDLMTVKNTSSFIPIDITLKLSTELGPLKPYIGFGPTIGVGGQTLMSSKQVAVTTIIKEWEYTYKVGFGWNATIGADYPISDMLSIFIGANLRSITLTLDKAKKTIHTVDGVDTLAGQNTEATEIEFVEDDTALDATHLVTQPTASTTWDMPFGTLSITLGVSINF